MSDRPPSPYLHLFVRAYQSRSQRRPLGTSRKTGLAKRVPRNTTGCLQAYDHLFTLTSQSEERTKQARWVWARPDGRAHTHSFRDASRQPRSVGSAARMPTTSSHTLSEGTKFEQNRCPRTRKVKGRTVTSAFSSLLFSPSWDAPALSELPILSLPL